MMMMMMMMIDDEFRFNDMSTHEGHLSQNGLLTWYGTEMAIIIRHMSGIFFTTEDILVIILG